MKIATVFLATLSSVLMGRARFKVADPSAKAFQLVVDAEHAKFKALKEGKNADYIPILTETPSELFGVVIVTREGKIYSAGDVDYKFSIQSVSKPFTAALIMKQQGVEVLDDKIGVEPTGLPFNSRLALELYEEKRSVNPLVNAGAIAAVSLVQASSEQERWNLILQNISGFAGSQLTVLEKVYDSEYQTAFAHRAIPNLLYNHRTLPPHPRHDRHRSGRIARRQLGLLVGPVALDGADLDRPGRGIASPGAEPRAELVALGDRGPDHVDGIREGPLELEAHPFVVADDCSKWCAGRHGYGRFLGRVRRVDVNGRVAGKNRRRRRHRRSGSRALCDRSLFTAAERGR